MKHNSFSFARRTLAALVLGLSATAPGWAQVQAVPSDRMLETIGVGTRFDWEYDFGRGAGTKLALERIGFRHLRMSLGGQITQSGHTWDSYYAYWSSYAVQKGLKLVLQCEGDPKSQLTDQFNKWMQTPAIVWGVEGPNETFGRQDWWSSDFQNSLEVQQFIYGLARPRGVNVLTWTTGGGAITYLKEFPNPDAYCTHANFHAYSWDTRTDVFGGGDGKQIIPIWQDFTINNASVPWGANVANYGHVGGLWAMDQWTKNPSKPKTISEWGYTWKASGDYYYQNVDSELSRAKYVLRNSFEILNAKVDKAYYHSLMDQSEEFGIANTDGTLRQPGQALANLFSLLGDPGHANDDARSLNYTLTTASGIGTVDDHRTETNEIHQSLLQKSNGKFVLALWADKPSHRGDTGSENATLTLNGVSASEVKLYLPLTNGTSAVQTLTNTSRITLSGAVAIPDHPLLIEITPASGTPASTGLANGAYTLLARHSGQAVDVTGSSTASGALLQLYTPNGTGTQVWQVTAQADGSYKLVNRTSGKAMDVAGGGLANGVRLQQWDDNGLAAQRFTIEPTSDGYYRLINKNSGKALDAYGAGTANGTAVIQWDYVSGLNQQWAFQPAGAASARANAPLAAAAAVAPASLDADLLAYPNPAADGQQATLRWKARQTQDVTVRVFSSLGRFEGLFTRRVAVGESTFKLPTALPKGTHYLRATIDGRPQSITLQVE